MKIERIKLKNYRNIIETELFPCEGVNIIFGENAQGKTNILEAIYLFTGLKSFRNSKDKELILFNKNYSEISVDFLTNLRKQNAYIKISDRRRAILNGVSLSSPTALMSKFPSALFSPGFMSIIQSGPGERRRFIDSAICQIKPRYASLLTEYQKLLKQRNAALKNDESFTNKKMFLECINDSFAILGDEIYKERLFFLDSILPFVEDIYNGLSSGKEKISFSYIKKGDNSNSLTFKEILSSHEKTDLMAKITLTGPHRDDLEININNVSAKAYGSQGQKRSAAIALKLAEAEIIKNNTNENPVILLDDVMSELDTSRQDYILNHIRDKQVFITCCEPSSILRMSEGKTFNIKNGKIV